MSTTYHSEGTGYPGAVRVDEDGDLEVRQLSVSTFVRLSTADKLALATDLMRSAALGMQAEAKAAK